MVRESKGFALCEEIKDINEINLNNVYCEYKRDGEAEIIVKKGDRVFIVNRDNNFKEKYFPEVTEQLKKIPFDFMIHTEICCFDNNFNSFQMRGNLKDLNKIQDRIKEYPLICVIHDIKQIRGNNVIDLPLIERKAILEKEFKPIIKEQGLNHLEVIDYIEGEENIRKFFEGNKDKENVEGFVFKNKNERYIENGRVWKKWKSFKEKILTFTNYEENPNNTITLTNEQGIRVLCANEVENVRQEIKSKGRAEINIQYLQMTKENKYRNISFRGLVKN